MSSFICSVSGQACWLSNPPFELDPRFGLVRRYSGTGKLTFSESQSTLYFRMYWRFFSTRTILFASCCVRTGLLTKENNENDKAKLRKGRKLQCVCTLRYAHHLFSTRSDSSLSSWSLSVSFTEASCCPPRPSLGTPTTETPKTNKKVGNRRVGTPFR